MDLFRVTLKLFCVWDYLVKKLVLVESIKRLKYIQGEKCFSTASNARVRPLWSLLYPQGPTYCIIQCYATRIIVVQLLSHVWFFATPWTAARQAPLSFTVSRSLLRFMSTEWTCYLTISCSATPFCSVSVLGMLFLSVFGRKNYNDEIPNHDSYPWAQIQSYFSGWSQRGHSDVYTVVCEWLVFSKGKSFYVILISSQPNLITPLTLYWFWVDSVNFKIWCITFEKHRL